MAASLSDDEWEDLGATLPTHLHSKVTRAHWRAPARSKACSLCSVVFTALKRRHHCFECGLPYCETHVRYTRPLNAAAAYDPECGTPCPVCETCFLSDDRQGLGATRSLTASFESLRRQAVEEAHLRACAVAGQVTAILAPKPPLDPAVMKLVTNCGDCGDTFGVLLGRRCCVGCTRVFCPKCLVAKAVSKPRVTEATTTPPTTTGSGISSSSISGGGGDVKEQSNQRESVTSAGKSDGHRLPSPSASSSSSSSSLLRKAEGNSTIKTSPSRSLQRSDDDSGSDEWELVEESAKLLLCSSCRETVEVFEESIEQGERSRFTRVALGHRRRHHLEETYESILSMRATVEALLPRFTDVVDMIVEPPTFVESPSAKASHHRPAHSTTASTTTFTSFTTNSSSNSSFSSSSSSSSSSSTTTTTTVGTGTGTARSPAPRSLFPFTFSSHASAAAVPAAVMSSSSSSSSSSSLSSTSPHNNNNNNKTSSNKPSSSSSLSPSHAAATTEPCPPPIRVPSVASLTATHLVESGEGVNALEAQLTRAFALLMASLERLKEESSASQQEGVVKTNLLKGMAKSIEADVAIFKLALKRLSCVESSAGTNAWTVVARLDAELKGSSMFSSLYSVAIRDALASALTSIIREVNDVTVKAGEDWGEHREAMTQMVAAWTDFQSPLLSTAAGGAQPTAVVASVLALLNGVSAQVQMKVGGERLPATRKALATLKEAFAALAPS